MKECGELSEIGYGMGTAVRSQRVDSKECTMYSISAEMLRRDMTLGYKPFFCAEIPTF
jgi:hypothetical protein